MQTDHDEETTNAAVQKIFDLARRAGGPDDSPWLLTVSLTHPHDLFEATPEYWNRYNHDEIDMPPLRPLPVEEMDDHSREIYLGYKMGDSGLTEEDIRNARHGYYAAISYLDDKIGQLLAALEQAGLDENTIIIFTSDHGEMLGNRGLWYKKLFWDEAAKVPLIFHAPERFAPRRVKECVSLVDLLPTLVELAGGSIEDLIEPVAGNSLTGLLQGKDENWPDTAYCELFCEGILTPRVMIRRGKYKFTYGRDEAPKLFDLEADPDELANLAPLAEKAQLVEGFVAEVRARWDLDKLEKEVILSQRRRRVINQAQQTGQWEHWAHQPRYDASAKYIRAPEFMPDIEKRYLLKMGKN